MRTNCPVRVPSRHNPETQLDAKSAGAIDPGQMNKWERETEGETEVEREGGERGGEGGEEGNVWRSVIVRETECCHTSTPASSPSQINTIFVFVSTVL